MATEMGFNRRLRRITAVAAGSVLLASVAACSSGGSTPASTASGSAPAALVKVSMGINPWIGYAPWYIAQEKGFFAAHGCVFE